MFGIDDLIGGIVKGVPGILSSIRSFITTKGDKMLFLDKLNEYIQKNNALDNEAKQRLLEAQKELNELEVKDRDSARNREIEVNKSSSNWLVKSTTSILALIYVLFQISMYIGILYVPSIAGDTIKMKILDSLSAIVLLIVGYYFGSSVSNDRNSGILTDVMKEKANNEDFKTSINDIKLK
jgi:hypothetical protein